MRVLLAIVVTVAQVAGPWLCCCGPARVLASASAPVRPLAAVTPVVADDEPAGGCPHCRHAAAPVGRSVACPTSPPNEPSSPAAPALPDRCPCGGVTLQAAPPTPAGWAADVEAFAADAPSMASAYESAPGGTGIRSGVAPVGVSELPFLTSETRLRVHHALRC